MRRSRPSCATSRATSSGDRERRDRLLAGAALMPGDRRAGRAVARRWSAIAEVMRHGDLRRLQLGWAAFFVVDSMATVALSVWAFGRDGTAGVGLLGVTRLLPGALALPLGAWAADRYPRRRVVTLSFASVAVAHAAMAAAVAGDAPAAVVYVLVGVASIAATPYRPAHLALCPVVARSPAELVATNVSSGTLEGLATFAGPAIAAVLLAVSGPSAVVAIAAAAAAGGAFAVSGISVAHDPSRAVRQAGARPLQALLGGVGDLRSDGDLAALVGCFVAQLLVRGVLGVLVVAVSFDLVDAGASGVGWLAAAMGLGGIVGAIGSISMTGRRRLAGPTGVALAAWGLPITLIGVVPELAVALTAMVAIGVANALLDVSGLTLIQRLGSDVTLGRVFGVLFTLGIAFGGMGAAVAPSLVSLAGVRPVLVGVGLVLPLTALALARRLRSIDQRAEPVPEMVGLLADVDLLAALPPTTLEKIAARAGRSDHPPGSVLVAEGDPGDRFYVVADGEVEVSRGGVHRRRLGRGDHFGEIALVRATPRTATVTARTDVRLVAITATVFLDAVRSSDAAHALAMTTTDAVLAADAGTGT